MGLLHNQNPTEKQFNSSHRNNQIHKIRKKGKKIQQPRKKSLTSHQTWHRKRRKPRHDPGSAHPLRSLTCPYGHWHHSSPSSHSDDQHKVGVDPPEQPWWWRAIHVPGYCNKVVAGIETGNWTYPSWDLHNCTNCTHDETGNCSSYLAAAAVEAEAEAEASTEVQSKGCDREAEDGRLVEVGLL